MNERIARMKERALNAPIWVGVEKLRIAQDTFEETRNRPHIDVRATLLANYMNRMPIFIPEDDLIAGTGASHFNGAEFDYEQGIWSPAEIAHLREELGDSCYISPEDEQELYRLNQEMAASCKNNRACDYYAELEWDNDRLRPFMKSNITLPAWKDRNSGGTNGIAQTGIGLGPGFVLMCPEYERVLNEGARALIDEAKACIAGTKITTRQDLEHYEYWQGVIKVFEAWINYAHRHADLAEQMAAEEKDETRKAELLQMAAICRRVPEYPAASFREAIQAFWFTFLAMGTNTMSAGRIDQYLYPFYRKDIDEGKITDEEVLELLEVIRCKCMTFHTVRGGLARGRHSGDSRWQNFILGGCDENGNDLSNELTMLFMQSALELKVPHHTITLRVNENTPVEVVKKGVDVVAAGVGMPAFVSDKSYINYFKLHGFSQKDASDYAICGCLDAIIPGRSRTVGVKFFNLPMVLDIFLHNGYCSFSKEDIGLKTGDPCDFKDYESFVDAYYQQQDYFMGLAAERANLDILIAGRVQEDPFRSALMRDGITCGEDIISRKFEPFDTTSTIMCVGGINIVNSFAAIKKLIFEEKKYTMRQLIDALDADWEGYEQMRKDFQNAPKYGNNDDYADSIAQQVYDRFDEHVEHYESCAGCSSIPSGISISAHQPAGLSDAATPDGRKAHEILADGMISPQQGTDEKGPLAVFGSGMKINQDRYQATLFNMKFHPSALKTDSDRTKLATAIKTYLNNGGKQIQMTVVDRETLEDAKVKPKEHKDVVVRVAGYSTYFVSLTPMMQDEIIARTENESVR